MIQGGCYCGSIRYQTKGIVFHETNCHCSICRHTSSAPFVPWFSVAKADFRLLGEPTRFRSSKKGTRSFCSRCGTPLTFEHDDFPEEIDITICSLDDPEAFPPKDHSHANSQLSWIKLKDDLPVYQKNRQEG